MSKGPIIAVLFYLSLNPSAGLAQAGVEASSGGTVATSSVATPNSVSVLEASTSPVERSFEGGVVDGRRVTATALDISYYLVLGLGIAGLYWMRRHAQSL